MLRKLKVSVVAGLVLLSLQAFSAKGTFYVGVDGRRNVWHVKQKLRFNGNVSNPTTLDAQYDKSRQRYSGDVMFGVKSWNGALFAALEGWYNADVLRVRDMDSAQINFNTRIGQRYGGRLLFGLQERNSFLYGLLGAGITPIRTQTTYPTGSIYRSVNVNLAGNNFSTKACTTSWGFGFSTTFENHLNVGIEYQHLRATSRIRMVNTNVGATNPVGTQRTGVSADTYNVRLAYQFLPFTF